MFIRIIVLLILFALIPYAQAEETEQFTLPPSDLVDIGPAASNRLYAVIEKVIAQTNADIQTLLPNAQHSRFAAAKLAARRNETYIADLVYSNTGPGYPQWMRGIPTTFENHPTRYNEYKPWKTIYWLVFSQSPLALIRLAPTINMYGYTFGTDKLGHFFMMGHTYYRIYTYYLKRWKSTTKAHAAIVTYGQILEQTYLGTLINGVYSNGDLSANYAGWKFYTNLTHSIKIGHKTYPPILVLRGNTWAFSPHVNKDTLLKPYISDNLNEALNPSRYSFMRGQIRHQVKQRCADWIVRKGITQASVATKLAQTSLWHGENYGHWLPASNAVTLATCFGGK